MKELATLSLYTGAGGLDLGFEAVGFDTTACVERDVWARSTLETNRPGWHLVGDGDVHRLTVDEIVGPTGRDRRDLGLVLAGPPCQPFSKSGLWTGGSPRGLSDLRAATLGALMDVVEAALPGAVVIENVPGMASAALAALQGRLDDVNRREGTFYRLSVEILSATSFGVPQVRERAFAVAFRDGAKFDRPRPTHGPGLAPFATAWDALGPTTETGDNLAALALTGKWAGLVPSVPSGGNYLHLTARGGGAPLFDWRSRYWSFLLKLAPDRPSWTVQANPGPATGPFHWEDRTLSGRELAALQGFPDGYVVRGSAPAVRRQVGNAVPPAMAEAVAASVRATLTGTRNAHAPRLATPPREGCPTARPPRPVPVMFTRAAGSRADSTGRERETVNGRRKTADVPDLFSQGGGARETRAWPGSTTEP